MVMVDDEMMNVYYDFDGAYAIGVGAKKLG